MKKMKIRGIILEGIDCSGKTTIKDRFNKVTNYKWFTVDRGFGSLISYGKHNNRKANYKRYYETDSKLSKLGFIIVYVFASDETLKERIKIKNDNDISIDEIQNLKNQYMQYLNKTKMNIIKIYTTGISLEESVDELINKLKTLGVNYYENY